MPDGSHTTRRIRRAGVATAMFTLVGAALGLWYAWPRLFPGDLARAEVAYERGDWTVSARLAREVLKGRPDDVDA
ncbi:hypothetical protein ACYOEI_37815, partial [Singulisphaera rosea]